MLFFIKSHHCSNERRSPFQLNILPLAFIEQIIFQAILNPSQQSLRTCGNIKPELVIMTHSWLGANPGIWPGAPEASHSIWLEEVFEANDSDLQSKETGKRFREIH